MSASNHDYERWAELTDRQAVGETLSEAEVAFVASYQASDPVARAEAALFESMADIGVVHEGPMDVALSERAVRAVLAEQRRRSRPRRHYVWAASSVLAAAAGISLFAWSGSHGGSVGENDGSVVEYVGGEARVDGVLAPRGTRLAPGSVVEAVNGPVCVAVEPRIHACLASGATVKLSFAFTAERRVELLSGRVAAALEPLPRGERFSIVANGVWSTAVGTAFTVELAGNGEVETIVHEGKVAVGRIPGTGLVAAHKIGLSHGNDVTVEPLGEHARTETPEWAILATVAHRSIEAVVANAPEPPLEAAPPAADEPEAPAPATRRALPRGPVVPAVAAPPAADLLATARQLLREQRWSDAAAAYQKLIGERPGSPEARTVVVPLAKLQIDRLGQPAAALPLLDAYVEGGGSLVAEARLARIRAYRALGRGADELHAIDEFLSAHPGSLEAEKLRERRAALNPR